MSPITPARESRTGMATGQNPRRRSPKANQKAIRRVNRRQPRVKNHPLRLQVHQALLTISHLARRTFFFPVRNKRRIHPPLMGSTLLYKASPLKGVDLKSIFRYRWAVKQKIVEGGLFQWLRP